VVIVPVVPASVVVVVFGVVFGAVERVKGTSVLVVMGGNG